MPSKASFRLTSIREGSKTQRKAMVSEGISDRVSRCEAP